MKKCNTEHRYPTHYFPMRVFVVDEKTGEETAHRLNYGNGTLTVSADKEAVLEPDAGKGKGTEKLKPSTEEKPPEGMTSSPAHKTD